MLVSKVWCDHLLYIWSSFIGLHRTNNDLHVFHGSSHFQDIVNYPFPFKITPSYKICDTIVPNRDIPYLLVDGIYPTWPIFNSPISDPTAEQKQYKLAQESVRKDIENAFGVRKGRFQILKNGLRFWKHEDNVEISE